MKTFIIGVVLFASSCLVQQPKEPKINDYCIIDCNKMSNDSLMSFVLTKEEAEYLTKGDTLCVIEHTSNNQLLCTMPRIYGIGYEDTCTYSFTTNRDIVHTCVYPVTIKNIYR